MSATLRDFELYVDRALDDPHEEPEGCPKCGGRVQRQSVFIAGAVECTECDWNWEPYVD